MRCAALRDYVGNFIALVPIGPLGALHPMMDERAQRTIDAVVEQASKTIGQLDISEVDVIVTLTEPGSVTVEKEPSSGQQGFPEGK